MTRVLLRDLPLMLRDILSHALSREPDVELLESMPEPPYSVARPDVVIGHQDLPDTSWVYGVLSLWPDCRVLLIASAGHQVTLFELHPHRTALGEMSLEELVSVVTRVVRDPRLSFERLDSTSKGKPAMADKPDNPNYEGGSGGASLADLVETLKGIRTDLVATRVGAPSPDVQHAIEEANALVGFLNESFAPATTSTSALPKDTAQLLGRIGSSTSVQRHS